MTSGDGQIQTKLPLIASVIEAFELTSANIADLAKLMWLWLLILIAVQAVIYGFLWPFELESRTNPASATLIPVLLPAMISTLIGTSIAVGWHRRLLKKEKIASSSNLRLDNYVWRYFLWAFLLVILCLAPIIIFIELVAAMPPTEAEPTEELPELLFLGLTLSALVIWLFTPRLALLLPAIAIGQNVSLQELWKRTRSNTWHLFTGIVLTSLPVLIIMLSIYAYLGFDYQAPTRQAFVVENCLIEVLSLLIGMFSVSFLSVAYRHFFGPFDTKVTTT